MAKPAIYLSKYGIDLNDSKLLEGQPKIIVKHRPVDDSSGTRTWAEYEVYNIDAFKTRIERGRIEGKLLKGELNINHALTISEKAAKDAGLKNNRLPMGHASSPKGIQKKNIQDRCDTWMCLGACNLEVVNAIVKRIASEIRHGVMEKRGPIRSAGPINAFDYYRHHEHPHQLNKDGTSQHKTKNGQPVIDRNSETAYSWFGLKRLIEACDALTYGQYNLLLDFDGQTLNYEKIREVLDRATINGKPLLDYVQRITRTSPGNYHILIKTGYIFKSYESLEADVYNKVKAVYYKALKKGQIGGGSPLFWSTLDRVTACQDPSLLYDNQEKVIDGKIASLHQQLSDLLSDIGATDRSTTNPSQFARLPNTDNHRHGGTATNCYLNNDCQSLVDLISWDSIIPIDPSAYKSASGKTKKLGPQVTESPYLPSMPELDRDNPEEVRKFKKVYAEQENKKISEYSPPPESENLAKLLSQTHIYGERHRLLFTLVARHFHKYQEEAIARKDDFIKYAKEVFKDKRSEDLNRDRDADREGHVTERESEFIFKYFSRKYNLSDKSHQYPERNIKEKQIKGFKEIAGGRLDLPLHKVKEDRVEPLVNRLSQIINSIPSSFTQTESFTPATLRFLARHMLRSNKNDPELDYYYFNFSSAKFKNVNRNYQQSLRFLQYLGFLQMSDSSYNSEAKAGNQRNYYFSLKPTLNLTWLSQDFRLRLAHFYADHIDSPFVFNKLRAEHPLIHRDLWSLAIQDPTYSFLFDFFRLNQFKDPDESYDHLFRDAIKNNQGKIDPNLFGIFRSHKSLYLKVNPLSKHYRYYAPISIALFNGKKVKHKTPNLVSKLIKAGALNPEDAHTKNYKPIPTLDRLWDEAPSILALSGESDQRTLVCHEQTFPFPTVSSLSSRVQKALDRKTQGTVKPQVLDAFSNFGNKESINNPLKVVNEIGNTRDPSNINPLQNTLTQMSSQESISLGGKTSLGQTDLSVTNTSRPNSYRSNSPVYSSLVPTLVNSSYGSAWQKFEILEVKTLDLDRSEFEISSFTTCSDLVNSSSGVSTFNPRSFFTRHSVDFNLVTSFFTVHLFENSNSFIKAVDRTPYSISLEYLSSSLASLKRETKEKAKRTIYEREEGESKTNSLREEAKGRKGRKNPEGETKETKKNLENTHNTKIFFNWVGSSPNGRGHSPPWNNSC